MSNDNTVSVKVLSDAREEEILDIFRTLHGKVLVALQECEIKPQFADNFGKCGNEDYKLLQQQARALISAKGKDRKEKKVAGIRTTIQGVVDTYMSQARTAKATMDAMPEEVRKFLPAFPATVKVPLSDIRACFPEGTTDADLFGDLTYMGYKITDLTPKGQVIVPFREAPKAEEAPESGNVTKAA